MTPLATPPPAAEAAGEYRTSVTRAEARRRLLARLVRVAVAITVLSLLFREVPIAAVAATLASAAPPELFAGIALALTAQWLIALRLAQYTAAQGLVMSAADVLQVNFAALFYGLFLPGGNLTGLAIRLYRLSGKSGLSAGAAVSILNDRITATATLCITGIVFWAWERPAAGYPALLVMLATLAGLLGLLGLLVTQQRFRGLRQLERVLEAVVGRRLHALREAVRLSRRLGLRRLSVAFGLSFAAHLLGIIGYVVLVWALGLDIPVVTVGWIRSGMILATMLPISVSGLGLREGAALLLLAPYGVSGEHAVALSLLVFGVTVLLPGLLGGASEAWRAAHRRPA